MRLKFQKQSVLRLAGRIIPQSEGFNTRDLNKNLGCKSAKNYHKKKHGRY
jgi:hypothetical protein